MRLFSKQDVLKDAAKALHNSDLPQPARRLFMRNGLTLGGLVMLTGCDLVDGKSVETMLARISRLNDSAQAWLFDPSKLAPTYTPAEITRPFPFNAYYPPSKIVKVDGGRYRLQVDGLVGNKRTWHLAELYALPQEDQITRHICVEGWSAIGRWGGVRFSDFLKMNDADLTAKYINFVCADGYYTSIDMPTALHPQTQLTLTYDGQILPPQYGYPMKLRMPTKLGYKNPKHIQTITVTNSYPGGYWEDMGYNWFGGS